LQHPRSTAALLRVVCVLAAAIGCSPVAATGQQAAVKGWREQALALVDEACRKHLPDWPAQEREAVRLAVGRSLAAVSHRDGIPRDSLDRLAEGLDQALEAWPPWPTASPEGAAAESAGLAWGVAFFLEHGPRSAQDRELLDKQAETVTRAAEAWCAAEMQGIGATVVQQALDSLRTELRSWVANPLVPCALRPLSAEDHNALLEKWLAGMAASRAANLVRELEMSLWHKRAGPARVDSVRDYQRALLAGLLLQYLNLRFEAGPAAPAEFSSAMAAYRRAQTLRWQDGALGMPTGRWDMAGPLQAYEILLVLAEAMDAASDGDLFPGLRGARSIGSRQPTALPDNPAVCYVQAFETRFHQCPWAGPSEEIEGSISGIISVSQVCTRLEVTGRTPVWRSRGFWYEPVGTSIASEADGLKWYHPGEWDFDVKALPAGILQTDSEVMQAISGTSPVLPLIFASQLTLDNGPGEPFGGKVGQQAQMSWPSRRPWLYFGRIDRAESTDAGAPQGTGGHYTIRLFSHEAPAPLATVAWSDPVACGSRERWSRVVAQIHRPALRKTRPPAAEGSTRSAAEPRAIIWQFAASPEERRMVPVSAVIRLATGLEPVSMSFGPPYKAEVPPGIQLDLKALLPLGQEDPGTRYYQAIKPYFRAAALADPERAEAAKVVASSCRALMQEACSDGEWGLYLAVQHLLMDALLMQDDIAEWG
jgi:hypothetical protein